MRREGGLGKGKQEKEEGIGEGRRLIGRLISPGYTPAVRG